MPSYLSSTQTGTPSRFTISAASSAGEASMNLIGWKRARLASASRSSRASSAIRPMSPVSIPAHFTASSGRSNAFAIAASTRPSRSPIRSSPDRTLTRYFAVSGSARARSSRKIPLFARRPGGRLDRGDRLRRPRAGSGTPSGPGRDRRASGRPRPPCPGPTTGRRPRRARIAAPGRGPVTVVAIVGPAEAGGALIGLGERTPGQEDDGDRELRGRQDRRGSRRGGRSSRRSGSWRRRARRPRSSDAWRAMVYRAADGPPTLVSRCADGRTRRPPAACPGEPPRRSERWYGDPEVVRLTRYQDGPMRARRDRAVLRRAGARRRTRSRWRSTSATRTA